MSDTNTNAVKPVSPHAGKRTPAQKLKDMADISQLFLNGMHQREMCDWIKANRNYTLSVGMINRIVKDVVRFWESQIEKNINKLKARDLMRLADVERRAVEAYERSIKTAERTDTTNERDGEQPAETNKPEANAKPEAPAEIILKRRKVRERVTKENRDGDPRFLSIILECVRQRAEILGYCKPKKLEITGEDGGAIKLDTSIEAALTLAYGEKPAEQPAVSISATVTNEPGPAKVLDWRAAMAGK